jgi:hypothetical protein
MTLALDDDPSLPMANVIVSLDGLLDHTRALTKLGTTGACDKPKIQHSGKAGGKHG